MMNFGNEDLVIKCGWLTKLGGNAIRKTWKRRWFVLKGNDLYYYRDQNVKGASSGVINLSLYNSVSQDTTITKKSQYCIRIEKVIKESDSIHSNLSTYHDIATISSSSSSSTSSTSSTVSTPVSIISSSKCSSKISKSTNNNNSNIISSQRSTSTTITLKKPSMFIVFTDNENDMQEWMTLLEKRLGDRNIVDIVLDRLDLANIGMHKRQGSYSSLRSFYSKNSSISGSTTTNSNLSSRRPSLDSLSLDTPSLDSRKSSMDSFRSNQNTISSNTIISNNNSDSTSYQSISRPETPSNLVALFGIGQPILRKPVSYGSLQDKRIINNSSANNSTSNINNTIIGDEGKLHTKNQSLAFFKDFNTNTTPTPTPSPSPLSSSTINTTISANNITSSNRQQCTPLIMVHGENSKTVTSSSPGGVVYFLGNDDNNNNIDLNDDEDSLVTPLANVFPSHLTDKFN